MTLSLLLTTVAKKSDARRLATASLQHRTAACIQIISGIESTTRKLKSLETLWKKIHPYDCPELITLSGRAATSYARWVQASVSS